MKLSREEAKKFRALLEQWEDNKLISASQRETLDQKLADETKNNASFDWRNLSFLAFFFSAICLLLATSLVLIDDWLEIVLDYVFDTRDWVKSLMLSLLASGLYYWALRRRRKHLKRIFSNELIFLFGAICVAFSMTYLGFSFDMYNGYYPILILIASLVYGLAGILLLSGINWYLALGALAVWFGTETAYRSDWDEYFLGMNYPMRYLIFGVLLLAIYRLQKASRLPKKFINSTYAVGLLSLFFSFWLLSIFGNFAELNAWSQVGQHRFIYWALALAIASAWAIWYGLRHQDRILRDMGIVFLLLNIYTRYFEYFWDSLHKVVFFSLLAVSFWVIGRKAENIWSLSES